MSLSAILVLGFSQVVTILLSRNLQITRVAGFNDTEYRNFSYQHYSDNGSPIQSDPYEGSGWTLPLGLFPTFAEYKQPGVKMSGVSDTGQCLRAFLPFSGSSDRQNLQYYRGNATVVDTRVTCQNPILRDLGITRNGQAIRGSVAATHQTQRLNNQTLFYNGPVDPLHPESNTDFSNWIYNESIPFECYLPSSYLVFVTPSIYDAGPDQAITLCQLPNGGSNTFQIAEGFPFGGQWSGGLESEFQPGVPPLISDLWKIDSSWSSDSLAPATWGRAYMVFNTTKVNTLGYGLQNDNDNLNEWSSANISSTQHHRDEWTELSFTRRGLPNYYVSTSNLSVSLCYSSFAVADLPIVMSSTVNRLEPNVSYDRSANRYTYEQIRLQLGQNARLLEDRGVLSLTSQRGNWIALPTELTSLPKAPSRDSYLRQFFNMQQGGTYGEDGNWTTALYPNSESVAVPDFFMNMTTPHTSIVWLFQEIVANGGSVAFALQSLYTVMAANVYYQTLPKFDATSQSYRVDFKLVNTPAEGWGYSIVLGMLLVHFVLLTIVVGLFLRKTSSTYLGEAWMTIAQTRGPLLEEQIFSEMGPGVITDDQVREMLKKKGMKRTEICLGIPEDERERIRAQSQSKDDTLSMKSTLVEERNNPTKGAAESYHESEILVVDGEAVAINKDHALSTKIQNIFKKAGMSRLGKTV
ncbi:hypothetical protein H2200_009102 [Cladophialophora chaetospira]|uniref:Uncharacterized protein n=1 Tax=Cladophialophora chaetospira TaxID=386627 RepID=A0AA38X3H1_9EURO|nr:hypothetical protein H2200_009102 [Cladophialophora chaetospira]